MIFEAIPLLLISNSFRRLLVLECPGSFTFGDPVHSSLCQTGYFRQIQSIKRNASRDTLSPFISQLRQSATSSLFRSNLSSRLIDRCFRKRRTNLFKITNLLLPYTVEYELQIYFITIPTAVRPIAGYTTPEKRDQAYARKTIRLR